jgi:hypothetical protein
LPEVLDASRDFLIFTAEARRRKGMKAKGFFSMSQRLRGDDRVFSLFPQRRYEPLPTKPLSSDIMVDFGIRIGSGK